MVDPQTQTECRLEFLEHYRYLTEIQEMMNFDVCIPLFFFGQ
jgi:hypothetical protein